MRPTETEAGKVVDWSCASCGTHVPLSLGWWLPWFMGPGATYRVCGPCYDAFMVLEALKE